MSDQTDPPYVAPPSQNNRGYVIGWSIGLVLLTALFIWYLVAK